ncbi:MAG: protease modulator HflC [Alphaproteobacteria bacterium]|nr:protease modulator HflC [Alphaproteobacteria bacterium]
MKRIVAIVLGVLAIAVIVVGSSALFTVHQTQQALVLQFGEPKRAIKDPGLKVKIPFIQDVQFYEKRTLPLDPPRQQVILIDQKRMDVDTFGRFRIEDPLRFFQTVGNETGARSRLSAIINSALRRVLGNVSLPQILSDERQGLIDQIRGEVNVEANRLGIEIVEVRIRRADYPEETSQAIFNRMRSEREREASEFRAEGEELSQQIRSDADRQQTVILAAAERQAQELRGEGDSQAIRIYAEAFGKDPDFFAFYRSMEAYRTALSGSDTTMVLSPDSDFFEFFNSLQGITGRSDTDRSPADE